MKFLIAMDSFKGCLSSLDAGNAVARGIRCVFADAEIEVCSIADGGEGTIDALAMADHAQLMTCNADGPYRDPVLAKYLIFPGKLAVIEMAQAAGLHLTQRRDVLYASTYGVGMMIRDAIEHGCRRFIVGIGGSATNDGGAGMLQALGFRLLDERGNSIERGAIGLKSLYSIDESHVLSELKECIFEVACDVTAPLLGEHGCSLIFGPQKGASLDTAREMDHWLAHYVDIIKKYHPNANPNEAGSGAAGGLGFALKIFCHAELQRGLPLIAQILHLEEKIQFADYIFTGEGQIDAQTMMGKVPVGIAAVAKKYQKPVIALVGAVSDDIDIIYSLGIDAVFSIQKGPTALAESMHPPMAQMNLSNTAAQIARLICVASRHE
ncbi:MAG: glycerate kinase [Proteobacteria bacterium]|nr:glycerate kinase [Pseudomonadota bacterium]